MAETLLFCIVFLSQALLISWLYPRRVLGRARHVLRNFPQSTHPRLYPQPPEFYARWVRTVERINFAIFFAGLLIIALIMGSLLGAWDGGIFAYSRSSQWSVVIVAPYFLLQLLAGVTYMNLSAGRMLQAMAKAPQPRVRTAELHRRRLVDFVSPATLVVVAITNIAFVGFVLYAHQKLGLPRFKVFASIGSVALALVSFSVTVAVMLSARRLDPYQAQQDRQKSMTVVVQQAVAVCIAFPVLFGVLLGFKLFGDQSLEPVMISLFVQALAFAMLWGSYSYRADQIDFDVYRQEAGGPRT